jgi:hypothetical protein
VVRPRRSTQLARIEGEQEVRAALREIVKQEGVRGLARRLKISPAAVSQATLDHGRVTARLARAVGFEKVILFRRVA